MKMNYRQDRLRVSKLPAVLFGTWLAIWVACELAFAPHMAPWHWIILLVVFLPIELYGAINPNKGDTFSELIWTFTGNSHGYDLPARNAVGITVGAALGLRALSIPYEASGYAFVDYGRALFDLGPITLLVAGVTIWLMQHFRDEGRDG